VKPTDGPERWIMPGPRPLSAFGASVEIAVAIGSSGVIESASQ